MGEKENNAFSTYQEIYLPGTAIILVSWHAWQRILWIIYTVDWITVNISQSTSILTIQRPGYSHLTYKRRWRIKKPLISTNDSAHDHDYVITSLQVFIYNLIDWSDVSNMFMGYCECLVDIWTET